MELLARESSTVADMFRRRVACDEDTECYQVRHEGQWSSTSWGQFAEQIDALSAGLDELGFEQGHAVGILGDCCPGWCVADLGAVQLGGTSVGIYPNLLLDQITFLLQDCSARVLFVQGAENLERVLPLLDAVESLDRLVIWDCEAPDHPAVHTVQALQERGRELPLADAQQAMHRLGKVGIVDVCCLQRVDARNLGRGQFSFTASGTYYLIASRISARPSYFRRFLI